MDYARRGQRNWFVVNIGLSYCKQYVPRAQKLDANILQAAVPKVLDDLSIALGGRFRIVSRTSDVAGLKYRETFALEKGVHVYATVFGSHIKLEAFAPENAQFVEIQQLLNDFRLQMVRSNDVAGISRFLECGRRKTRVTAAKIIGEAPDARFIPELRKSLNSDHSITVRREVLRALIQLEYPEKEADFREALKEKDDETVAIAEAYIFGNRFKRQFSTLPVARSGNVPDVSKITGAVVGLVVGDVIGRPVESLARWRMLEIYGKPISGIQVAANPKNQFGQFSDDMEETLLVTETLKTGNGFRPEIFAGLFAEHAFQIDTHGIPNNGYGPATIKAGRNLYRGIPWTQSGLDYPTCGPSTRVVPLAIYYHDNLAALEEALVSSSEITHKNRIAIAGAIAVGFAVAKILSTSDTFNGRELIEWLAPKVAEYDQELSDKLHLALKLAQDKEVSTEAAYEMLGNSSNTRQLIPLAFYAFLKSPTNYRETVLTAVNAGGDTDSSAAISGAFSGALNGSAAVPEQWVEKIENLHLVYDAVGFLSRQPI